MTRSDPGNCFLFRRPACHPEPMVRQIAHNAAPGIKKECFSEQNEVAPLLTCLCMEILHQEGHDPKYSDFQAARHTGTKERARIPDQVDQPSSDIPPRC